MTDSNARPPQEPVDYRLKGAVASVMLNRPSSLNAITDELTAELVAALDRAARDGARIVLLTGAGRAFCAGHDLRTDEDHQHGSAGYADSLQDVTRRIRSMPAIVISAVQGYALGGGFEFVLTSDLVIAARDAVFGFPEVGVGLSVTGGVTKLLTYYVGPLRAKQLLLTGERLGSDEAKNLGLVNWVVERDELRSQATSIVKQLLDRPALSVTLAKRAIDAGLDNSLESQLELETSHLVIAEQSPEAARGRAAFRSSHSL